ncbi:3-dehydroquinate synthase [Caulifigura coniformis]|uniref:3-dehydroquinate synthase n=1 Tax=Caulifigura coniformis TaxID=2527983 RepID=A0A517SJE5_9PLAN|nr:3-dehydroquinate synthase [Caulifigura coniformis]QDT56251.1 3-dehydroquinate synthase [Caulifigura coniformis]
MTGSESIDISFAVPCVHRLRFTSDLLGADQAVLAHLLEPSGDRPARVQVWIDEHVAAARPDLQHRLKTFLKSQPSRFSSTGNIQLVPGGEAIKNDIHILERMLKCMNAAELDRRSYVVVIGGGAVLDAVGFATAIAHRGIRLIRIPTTTLAQADSGVGVKNSVNLFQKKNWVGTFAVPWGVINDAAMLSTLPDRDFLCGFSEAVKVSLLKDPAAFEQVCELAGRIRQRDWSAASPVIRRSAQLHLEHITQGGDPYEALEARPLDFGHWSAHKLEVLTDYRLRHGEAVGIGVAIDTIYSSLRHGLPAADADRALHCLAELGLPLNDPSLADPQPLFDGLEEFRQHLGGRLTVTMLQAVGRKIDVHEIDRGAMREAIHAVRELGQRSEAVRPTGAGAEA